MQELPGNLWQPAGALHGGHQAHAGPVHAGPGQPTGEAMQVLDDGFSNLFASFSMMIKLLGSPASSGAHAVSPSRSLLCAGQRKQLGSAETLR